MLRQYIEENKTDLVFYRNSYRRFIYVALFILIINYALVGLLFHKLFALKVPPNFATTSDGRLINIKSSD